MKKLITFVILGVLFGAVNANAAEYPWKEKKNHSGIKVVLRKVEGSANKEFRGVGIVPGSLSKVVKYFEDGNKHKDWGHLIVESKVLERDEKSFSTYLIIDLPWPVTDRDFVFKLTKVEDTEKRVRYEATTNNSLYPEQEDLVRVNYAVGEWIFEDIGNNEVRVTWQQHQDVGGKLPTWIANLTSVDIPFGSINGLRKKMKVE